MKKTLFFAILALSLSTAFGQGSISGRVLGPDNQPLAGVIVRVYRWTGFYWQSFSNSSTDVNGAYSIEGLVSDTYRLGFSTLFGDFAEEYYNNSGDLDSATDVVVGASEDVVDIDVTLARASTISGTVLGPDSQPLQGVQVLTFKRDALTGWSSHRGAYTDSNGAYTIVGLSEGLYRLEFYDWQTRTYLKEYYDNADNVNSATDIVLGENADVVGIDATLVRGSTISGTVTGPGGSTGLEAINVSIHEYVQFPGYGYWSQVTSVNTDAHGDYTLGGLSPKTYRIGFNDWNGTYITEYYSDASDLNSAQDVVVGISEDVTGIDASLVVGARISGAVQNDQAEPLANRQVSLYHYNGNWWNSTRGTSTDSNGNYSFGGLTSGTYRIWFREDSSYLGEVWDDIQVGWPGEGGTDIPVSAGETVENIDAVLTTGGILQGIVQNKNNQPIPNISVTAYSWNSQWGYWQYRGRVTTDAAGTYAIGNLRTGSYKIQYWDYSSGAYVEQVYGSPNISSVDKGGSTVEVTAGQTTQVPVVQLQAYGSISGIIRRESNNTPLSDVVVKPVSMTPFYRGDLYALQVTTDVSGSYTVRGLRPGNYFILASTGKLQENVLSEWYGNELYISEPGWEQVPAGALSVTVGDGQAVNGIHLNLDTGSSFSGQVTGEGDVPLQGVTLTYSLLGTRHGFDLVTDDMGYYQRQKLVPGDYSRKVSATGYQDEWYNDVTHEDESSAYVVLPASQIVGEEIDLVSGQSPALVSVDSNPAGASVYLNFQPTGELTPVTLDLGQIEGVHLASHVITVWHQDYPKPEVVTPTPVEAETVEVMFELDSPSVGSLEIETSPGGATVYVDVADTSEGVTPITVGNLAVGSHVVLIKKAGYLQPRPVVAWVKENEITEVDVPLVSNALPSIEVEATSEPEGMEVLVNYLPTTDVTDIIVGNMDPASHSGDGWYSASHTIMLRHDEWGIGVPRYAHDSSSIVHETVIFEDATDTDGNGLPDQWEEAYDFENQAPEGEDDADGDADGDGISNEDELKIGTNPLDARSKVEAKDLIVEKQGNTDKVTMTFQTVPGRNYVVQTTQALGARWVNISGVVTATSSSTTFVLMIPPDTVPKFYRLLILSR